MESIDRNALCGCRFLLEAVVSEAGSCTGDFPFTIPPEGTAPIDKPKMTFVTMSLVVEDEFDDASAGLSVIMEEESCASSMFTEPADDTGTLALMEVTATRDYNNEDYSDEKWFPLLAPSPVIGSSKPMPPNPTAMPIVETKGTAARLFEYKKKLAIVWRRLEKAERRFLQVQETTCKAPLSPPPPREEPPNIPVKITVETTD
eukprot:jgi/Psemu1/60592/gm1.60592_g